MEIRWQSSKKYKPQIILDKIEAAKRVDDKGLVSFNGFEYQEALPGLNSMLEFPEYLSGIERDALIWKTISSTKDKLTKESVLARINELLIETNKEHESLYCLLTSISMESRILPKSTIVNGFTIANCGYVFPEKYKARLEFINETTKISNPNPDRYTKVIVKLKEKTPLRAAENAINTIDYLRSIMCLFVNSRMQLSGDEWDPINKIRLGELHTIHDSSGGIPIRSYWFEPNFKECKIYTINENKNLWKNVKIILGRIEKSSYKEIIKESLLRFVRALDEKDQHTALIKLWSALECISGIENAKYDNLVKRVAFLFEEEEYNEQLLEHLRDHRNRSVHSGDQSSTAKNDCYQVQYYFYYMILFHINNYRFFKTIEEANLFLDLPTNPDQLRKKERIIKRAIKYRTKV